MDDECLLIWIVKDDYDRRAIVAGLDFALPISLLFEKQMPLTHLGQITSLMRTPELEIMYIMNTHSIHQFSLLDAERHVVDVVLLNEQMRDCEMPMQSFIMVGVFCVRSRSFTVAPPNNMLPFGDNPLLQHSIEQLCMSGILRVNVTRHYKSGTIILDTPAIYYFASLNGNSPGIATSLN